MATTLISPSTLSLGARRFLSRIGRLTEEFSMSFGPFGGLAAGEVEYAFGDDVALNLGRAGGDGAAEGVEIVFD